MHYTRISTNAKQSFLLDIQCEACNMPYQVKGSYNAYSQVEAGGYVTKVDGATRQFLADGVKRQLSATGQALLNGQIDQLASPISFDPGLEAWRCPKCGYAQSWMVKGFHYGGKALLLSVAGMILLNILAALVHVFVKYPEVFIFIVLGISLLPFLVLSSLFIFAPWIIKHPNQKWFREHDKARKDAPSGRKPDKITLV